MTHDLIAANPKVKRVKQVRLPSRMSYLTEVERWRALEGRDQRAEGRFVYSVKTTGVYCRPTCAARLALRKNVLFFETCAAAEEAGFRACKRCRPNGEAQIEREAEAVRRACRMIEEAESAPGLEELARTAGFSRFHFLRLFKK